MNLQISASKQMSLVTSLHDTKHLSDRKTLDDLPYIQHDIQWLSLQNTISHLGGQVVRVFAPSTERLGF